MVGYPGFNTCGGGFNGFTDTDTKNCSNGQFSGSAEQYSYAWSGYVFSTGTHSVIYFNTYGSSSPSTPPFWSGGTLYVWESFSFFGYMSASGGQDGGEANVGPGFDVTTTYCYKTPSGGTVCNTTTTEHEYIYFAIVTGQSGKWGCSNCGVYYSLGKQPAQGFHAGGGLFTSAAVGTTVGDATADFWSSTSYHMSTYSVSLSDCIIC